MPDPAMVSRAKSTAKSLLRRLPGIRSLDAQRNGLQQRLDEQTERLADLERRAGFVPPGHFYSPIPSLDEFEADVDRIYADRGQLEIAGIEIDDQRPMLEALLEFYPDLPFSDQRANDRRYHFANGMFDYADGVFLYAMLRLLRPRRLIEVGSGYSSAVILDTSELFFDHAIELTFIEPYTDRLQSLLRPADHDHATIIERRVQDVPLDTFGSLGEGDVLFVDSTHVSKIGSDVNHLFFEVLPSLNPGVYVHIHDVMHPFEYPPKWVRDGRAWNEAYLLRAFLQYNREFEVVLFGSQARQFHGEWLAEHMPWAVAGGGAGSIWLRRRPG